MGFKIGLCRAAGAAIFIVTALAACPTGPHAPGTAPATAVAPSSPSPSPSPPSKHSGPLQVPGHQGGPYDVVSGESLLTILAFRGGALARAGHNHVIASHDVTGTVYVPADPLHSTFELRVPVAQLSIDEPQLRAKEGADFPTDVPAAAKEGTRRNMLSQALLNGAGYPEITLVSQRIDTAGPGAAQTEVQVTVRGQTHSVKVPVVYALAKGQLVASGELSLKQTDLGLTPFSAMLGALQVQDELHVRFRIVARRSPTKGAPGH